MVLSSWPKPLREFTRFIWCMQTECRGGRQSPYQANRLGLWVWHVLLKCWIQTRRTRACRRIRRRKMTTTRMECWRPIWTRTSWFSRTMLSMSATSFYEFTIQQTKCRPVLTERSGSVCQLLCALGLHYPHRYHTIVIDPTIRQLGFDLPRHGLWWTWWGQMVLSQSPSCDCGQRQTTNHIVDTFPLTKSEGWLSLLHEADDDAVIWLESTATAALAK